MATSGRRRLYQILEANDPDDAARRVVDVFLGCLIVANVGTVVLETEPAFYAAYGVWFRAFDVFSVAIFSVEFATRLWVATESPITSHDSAWRARRDYVLTPLAIIDLAAILPFYLAFFVPVDLRVLRVFRLLRILKLARYSPALATLRRVLHDERRALGAALMAMVALLLTSATAIYYAERLAQPADFGSIPKAMWWALATLTTVGYGDVVPVTVPGRLLGGVVMIFGLAMFALPVGIIASGFAQEIHRRDFVVTWGMVARVPLFATLSARTIGRVARLLRSREVAAGTVITRQGEPAHGMFFIVSGEVELDLHGRDHRLAAGEFFGEIALLHRAHRAATARAVTQTRLMELDARDFNSVIDERPDLRARVERVARSRRGPETVDPGGDLVEEEFD